MTIKQLKKAIEEKKAAIAKIRDELRELIADAEEMLNDNQDAIDHLDCASNALSRLQ